MKLPAVVAAALLAVNSYASVQVGFEGPAVNGPDTRLVKQGGTQTQDFTSNGFQWTADMNGDTSGGAAVYYYRGVGVLNNTTLSGQFMVDSPPGATDKGVVWLDGSQGKGTSRGGVGFNLGPAVTLSLLNLNVGQTYTVDFQYNTEVNVLTNQPDNTKGGPSGILVSANGLPTSQFITQNNFVPETNPSTAPWTHGAFSFIAVDGINKVSFFDDTSGVLNNELLSSNAFLADVTIVPETMPLVIALGACALGALAFHRFSRVDVHSS